MLAAATGRTETVQVLLAVPEINVNVQDQGGNCAHEGHKEIVQMLLSVPEFDDEGLSLALGCAVENNHTKIVELLDKEIRWARRRHYAMFLSGTYRNAGGGEEDEGSMRRRKREEGKMNSALYRVLQCRSYSAPLASTYRNVRVRVPVRVPVRVSIFTICMRWTMQGCKSSMQP